MGNEVISETYIFGYSKDYGSSFGNFIHLPGYTMYMNSDGVKQWIYLFLTMFTRVNTPLFMMISGALLLGKSEKYFDLISKRIFRYIVVIIAANTMIWMLYRPFDMKALAIGILKGNIQGSYWYLYSYLGMLFCLPLTRKIASNMTKQDFIYVFIIHFLFSTLLPCVNEIMQGSGFVIQIPASFSVVMMIESSIFYPIMGYCLHNVKLKRVKNRWLWILVL